MMRQKEQNKQHPIYRLFNTRTGTIRKHHQRGKISDALRREALYLAESYRDKALMDNDYAESGYARDMELEHIYAEAEKRLMRSITAWETRSKNLEKSNRRIYPFCPCFR